MIIDCYAHVCPQKYIAAFPKVNADWGAMDRVAAPIGGPGLMNAEKRIENMAKFKDYVQVLVPVGEVVEPFLGPKETVFLAQLYNDTISEWIQQYPDKFVAAVAAVPMNDIDAALKEIDRAITKLGFKGIYLHTPVFTTKEQRNPVQGYDYENVKALDAPEFMPIYEKMAKYDLPIWIHPVGFSGVPIYKGESRGKHGFSVVLGWPFESAMFMYKMVCSGVMTKYPNLKFITHHCGSGTLPLLGNRISNAYDGLVKLGAIKNPQIGKDKHMADYFKKFYADTMVDNNVMALECGYDFFGADHMVLGSDFPLDFAHGVRYATQAIDVVNRMKISDAEKQMIFEGNAKRIMHL